MDILYLLIPMSVVLVLLIVAVFGWAINAGQLEDLDREGERILEDISAPVDKGQSSQALAAEESPRQSSVEGA